VNRAARSVQLRLTALLAPVRNQFEVATTARIDVDQGCEQFRCVALM
jgi:hypothetical protein